MNKKTLAAILIAFSGLAFSAISLAFGAITLIILPGLPLFVIALIAWKENIPRLTGSLAVIISLFFLVLSVILLIMGYEDSELFGLLYLLSSLPAFFGGVMLLRLKRQV